MVFLFAQPEPSASTEFVLGFLLFASVLFGLVAASTGISNLVFRRPRRVQATLSIAIGLVPVSVIFTALCWGARQG